MTEPTVVRLNPSRVVFELHENVDSEAVIEVTNISDRNVVFKVKTKTPQRYYVKPNYGIISVAETQRINIAIIAKNVQLILYPVEGQVDDSSLQDSRFLIQSMAVEDSVAAELRIMQQTQLSTYLHDLFEAAPKETKKGKRIDVELIFPPNHSMPVSKPTQQSSKAPVDLSDGGSPQVSVTLPNPPQGDGKDNKVDYEKKYNSMMTYCMRQGEEKDNLQRKCTDLMQKISKLESLVGGGGEVLQAGGESGRTRTGSAKKGGITIIHLLIVAIIFLLIGKFYA